MTSMSLGAGEAIAHHTGRNISHWLSKGLHREQISSMTCGNDRSRHDPRETRTRSELRQMS